MTNCPPSENDRHGSLIRLIAYHFVILGYTDIRADLDGYPQPSRLGNHIPDLTARKRNILLSVSDKGSWETHKHPLEMTLVFLTCGHLLSILFRGRGWIYYIT